MLTVLALGVTVLLTVSAGAAQAEAPKLVVYGGFSSGSALPYGVAVDQPSGAVYVAGLFRPSPEELGHVDKFDATGGLLAPPSPFAKGYDGGVAVNPTNGDVYVLSAFGAIETYDPNSGAPIGEPFAVQASGNVNGVTVVQIAADSAGNVYVPVVPENKVLEYDPATCVEQQTKGEPPPCKPLKTFTGGSGSGALKGPTGVAVDSSGNLWVADSANNRIVELDSSDAPVEVNGKPVEINSEGIASIALDGRGDVLAIVKNHVDSCGPVTPPCSHLVEYTSAGVQVADVGAGSFESGEPLLFPAPPVVAVNESSGRVYVNDASNKRIWIFGPPAAPAVDRELAGEVGTSEAKLGALISPGGIQTTYSFEYDTREYAKGEGPHGQSTPFPEGSVGEGISSHAVWATASGLMPGTTYHFRVVARNELGAVFGPDHTFTTLSGEQAACPNEQFRSGFSARLPDCRAYELLTPPVKNSAQFDAGGGIKKEGIAAKGGNALSLFTKEPLPGAPTAGQQYVATRGASGWTLEDIIPLESYAGILCTAFTAVPAYSQELSSEVMVVGKQSSATTELFPGNAEACNADGIQVVSGEPVGYENLLVRENATGTYRLLNIPPPGVTPAAANFHGASADLSHVIFSELAPLTKDAPPGVEDLYEWDEGAVRLLTVLPDGSVAQGSLPPALPGEVRETNAISADGSHILFTAGGDLYARVNGGQTVQVDESQAGSGASGGGVFQAASADGAKVFFTDERGLTPGSTAQSGKPDLYECALPEGAGKCHLTDLSVAAGGEPADVLRAWQLGSQDGSHVYFLARGVLASNKRGYTNAEGNAVVEGAQAGQQNLYLRSGAGTTFIATLSESDNGETLATAVSPDGAWFAFDSFKSMTGYDNTQPTGLPASEIYLYNAASTQIVCASCNPSGEAPVLGGAAPLENRRQLADGGRLFFETREALAPSDTNGQGDVYEYENGEPRLISSGTSPHESVLIGASESGDDVFINTIQQLVPQDTQEGMTAVYDARVRGGFPAPASPPPCATADACRAPVSPQPSIYGAPSSQTFSGAGNLKTPMQAKAKKKAKRRMKRSTCKHGKHRSIHCQAKRKGKSHRGG